MFLIITYSQDFGRKSALEKLVNFMRGENPFFSIKRANCCESRNLPQTPQPPKKTTKGLAALWTLGKRGCFGCLGFVAYVTGMDFGNGSMSVSVGSSRV